MVTYFLGHPVYAFYRRIGSFLEEKSEPIGGGSRPYRPPPTNSSLSGLISCGLTAERRDAGVVRYNSEIGVAELGGLQRLKQRVADEHADCATESTAQSQRTQHTDTHRRNVTTILIILITWIIPFYVKCVN